MAKPRSLLVVFPAQGHVNPALQLAKRLILIGCEVTFVTTIHAHRRMITKGGSGGGNNDNNNFTPPNGMSFAAFSDGDDEGLGPKQGVYTIYGSEIRRRGTQALKDLVQSGQNEGRPYTCMVYTLIMPWAMDVAAELEIPVALFWVQTATVFDVCNYYFHGYGDLIRDKYNNKDYSGSLTFPGLPLDLTVPDLPSILDLSGFSSKEEKLSCRGELEKLGIIVPRCGQVEVLCNKALGCFVTHDGWNSTLESLVCGVPVVVFPQFVDQTTNAKLIEDLWKTGVRVKANEEGVVGAEEIKRCLELVILGGDEMRRNAKKWRDLARKNFTFSTCGEKIIKIIITFSSLQF
ncbi:hypothetical protein TIFTF001_031940 [Ficus carica]|uniref:Uncharacterized protein n=1 Tax=Ficus carica TaxID=3494 RepID=A0AA88DVU7_FICCA|nr:hypothetical protein TIFTF001_031940 [Ficus carica]